MKYQAPYGSPGGPNDTTAVYINGNPSTGTMGSIPPAASIEYPQREIVEMITDSGLVPDDADLKQLAKGIQLQRVNFAVDAGTVNNLQVTLAPVPQYKNGLIVRVMAVHNNTGPAVINVNAMGAKKIRRAGDTDLLANDLTASSIATLVYNENLQAGAGAFELQGVGGLGAGGYMTQNLDLYVNYAVGNDANDGTDNTSAHAVKNIQRAIDIAWSYRPSQFTLTIHVADSQSYTSWATPFWQGPNLVIVGNETTPAAVLITAKAVADTHACNILGQQTVQLRGLKATTPVGFRNNGFQIWSGAVSIINCEAGYCEYASVGGAGDIQFGGTFTFSGGNAALPNGTGLMFCGNGGTMGWYQCAMNISVPISSPVFMTCAFGFCQINAAVSGPILNPGNFTGQRYAVSQNGIIQTLGGGPTFFPGTIAGTTSTGGQYS